MQNPVVAWVWGTARETVISSISLKHFTTGETRGLALFLTEPVHGLTPLRGRQGMMQDPRKEEGRRFNHCFIPIYTKQPRNVFQEFAVPRLLMSPLLNVCLTHPYLPVSTGEHLLLALAAMLEPFFQTIDSLRLAGQPTIACAWKASGQVEGAELAKAADRLDVVRGGSSWREVDVSCLCCSPQRLSGPVVLDAARAQHRPGHKMKTQQ